MRITTTALLATCVIVAACGKADQNKPQTDPKPAVATAPATPPATPATTPQPAPTTPAGAASDTHKLIPADAALLAHVDLKRLTSSPLWAANRSLLDADPEVKKQLESLAACNMAFDGLRTLDIGVAPDGMNFAVIATGTGIGKPENLRCLHDRPGDKDWTIDAAGPGGRPRLVADNGEAFGHPVDDDTISFVSKGWDPAVLGLLTGKGTSVRDGMLKDVLAQADQSKSVWFAGNLPPQLAAMATAAPGMQSLSGLKTIAGSLDLSTGLGLVLAFGMEDPDRARATLAELQKQFAGVKPAASMLGIPSTAVDKVSFATKDAAVTMAASLTMDEINAMTQAMRGATPERSGPLGTVPPPIDQGKSAAQDAPDPGPAPS
ncbi:MAG: hypothetical protein H0T76_28910, partial [Nannocystis sp.]